MDHSSGTASSSSDTSSSTHTMDMSSMAMTFFTSQSTALYSTAWSPTSQGSYAGTCIFLIVLGALLRLLLALKGYQERKWQDADFARKYVVVQGKPTVKEEVLRSEGRKTMTLISENGLEEEVVVVRAKGGDNARGVRPWRLTRDPARACMDTVIAGVGYLLMLAVMTMNVGYFLSVLGGVFLGSLVVGRYTVAYGEHDYH